MGFLMQGNNVGLVLGPVAAASLVTMFGWFSVSGLIAAIALAAGTLSLSLPALRKPARHRKF
jgi:MFS transporter, DHA1 family, inner membrane transport protein